MYNNNILNFQESTTILNVLRKMSGYLSYAPRRLPADYVFEQKNLYPTNNQDSQKYFWSPESKIQVVCIGRKPR